MATCSVLLCTATAFSTGAVAEAHTVTGYVASQSVGTIDPSALITLKISKPQVNPYNDTPAGQLPDGGLAGYTFTITRVSDVDLSTQSGWDTAVDMQPEDATKHLESESRSAVTDASGSVAFTNLPVGLYYVRETPPNDTTHHWAWADPFLITLPTGDINGNQWDYNVEMVAKTTAQPFEIPEPTPTPTPTTTPTTTPGVPTIPIIPGIPSQPPRTSTSTPTKSTPARPTPGHPATNMPGSGGGSSAQGQSTPGLFGGGGNSGRSGISSLASTGANVIGIIIVGLLLVALGVFLSRRKKEED